MHKLFRKNKPRTLDCYKSGRDEWKDYILIDANKTDIWNSIFEMQGKRCAYCECEIESPLKGHVEHFFQRSYYPKLKFEWTNLFGSCRRTDGCGFYKDNQRYKQNVLIKLDVDNPDEFFNFLADGSIVVKKGLSNDDSHRASETLRVFGLDAVYGSLRQERASAIRLNINLINELRDYFETYGYDLLFEDFLNEALENIEGIPFQTAVRHMLYYN